MADWCYQISYKQRLLQVLHDFSDGTRIWTIKLIHKFIKTCERHEFWFERSFFLLKPNDFKAQIELVWNWTVLNEIQKKAWGLNVFYIQHRSLKFNLPLQWIQTVISFEGKFRLDKNGFFYYMPCLTPLFYRNFIITSFWDFLELLKLERQRK